MGCGSVGADAGATKERRKRTQGENFPPLYGKLGCAGHGRLPLFYRENIGGKAYLVFPIIYNKIHFVFAFLQETSLVPLVDGNTPRKIPLPTIDRHRPVPLLLLSYRKLYRGSFMHQQEKKKTKKRKNVSIPPGTILFGVKHFADEVETAFG